MKKEILIMLLGSGGFILSAVFAIIAGTKIDDKLIKTKGFINFAVGLIGLLLSSLIVISEKIKGIVIILFLITIFAAIILQFIVSMKGKK